MNPFISIIIPTYNGGSTIGPCLAAACTVRDAGCEVIVVDDSSNDGSSDLIRKFPCRYVPLEHHAGAAAARNAGAAAARGDVLFFIDADCVLKDDTIATLRRGLAGRPGAIIGGTYEPSPYDPGFFNHFQSAFINYSETRNCEHPDYIATHALAINADIFRRVGGFRGDLPILEDVEFSHRLRNAGYRLVMDPDLRVRHIFNFSLRKSLRNAVRKTRYWIEYSLSNRDILADSGTASREIKINGILWLAAVVFLVLVYFSGQGDYLLLPILLVWGGAATACNRHTFRAFSRAGGGWFAFQAALYYSMIYPAAIWIGAVRGVARFALRRRGN